MCQVIFLFSFFLSFFFFRATSMSYGESQARGQIRAVAASLHHSHNTTIQATSVTYTTAHGNAESLSHWARPGIKPVSSWILVRFIFAEPRQELPTYFSLFLFSFLFLLFFFFFFFFFSFFFHFLGPHLQHMDVPKLGVRLDLSTATSLHHSHSNARSKPHLQPAPQFRAMLNPQPIEQGQGLNSHPHGC